MEKRTDHYTALLIAAVLHAAARQGIGVSAHALQCIGLSLEVAVRVSTRPSERRARVGTRSRASTALADDALSTAE